MYLATLVLIPLANIFWQQLLLCFPRAVGGAISIAAVTALGVEEGRKFGMGSTMSILMMAMSIGFAVGPLLSGVIADSVDINAVFYFGGFVAFIGTGLKDWLWRHDVNTLVIAGLTTNHCVSTTARMAENLDFITYVVSDATAAFDRKGVDGGIYPAQLVHEISLANLNEEFATIVNTASLIEVDVTTP